MKFLIVFAAIFAAIFAVAVAAPGHIDADAEVLHSNSDVHPDGYQFAYETSNGISGQESAQLKNAGSEHEALEVTGSYSYHDLAGALHQISYLANENGFQPQGADIPVAPQA